MNGIVHPCTHPEGRPAPETEEEMMVEVFRYTERVVNMARPRKVLMMAIDGVAPRAKMNQQRSRRFRSAQEAHDKEIERQESIKMYEAMGHPVSEETRNKKAWDSNAITPGTPFMDLLSKSLKYWVATKLSSDPGWKDVSHHPSLSPLTCSSRSSSRTRQSLVRESTRLSIGSAASVRTRRGTPTPATPCTV